MSRTDIDPALVDFHDRTPDVYRRSANAYDRQRSKGLFEKPWLDRFLAALPRDGQRPPAVLDIGCGAGEPISSYLITHGVRLIGVDIAGPMLALARQRFPEADWIEADMRELDLSQGFGGVISWHGFFHLSRDEQRAALPRLAAHVVLGGTLMLTIGHGDMEVTGTVDGETVYHSSLTCDEYRAILAQCGFEDVTIVLQDPACQSSSVLLARGKAGL